VIEHAQVNLYRGRVELKTALQQRQLGYFERIDSEQSRETLEHWLEQNQKSIEEILIVKFQGRYGNAWLIFDEEARYLGYFRPVDLPAGNTQ